MSVVGYSGVSCLLYIGSCLFYLFFFKQKTAYEMLISDWSSDVCSSDLTVLMCSEIVADVGGQIGVVLDEQDAHLSFLPLLFALRVDLRRTRHHDEIGRASCRERVCQ